MPSCHMKTKRPYAALLQIDIVYKINLYRISRSLWSIHASECVKQKVEYYFSLF